MCQHKEHTTAQPGKSSVPVIRRIAVLPIYLYRYTLSAFLGRRCRFEPTCSVYAIEAIERHGIVHGTRLSLWRIGRCNPWGNSGYDPVPEKLENMSLWGWKNQRMKAKHKK